MKYIEVEVRTALIAHGYDSENRLIEEHANEEHYVRKIVALDRIRSISEQYLLVSTINDREVYWEYKGTMDSLKKKLQNSNLLIE